MKSSYALYAALLLCGAAFAGTGTLPAASNTVVNGPVQNQLPHLSPSCVPGFAYSVKEQFGNPVTGHLWFICRANVQCPGEMTAATQGSATSFRFVYQCKALATMPTVCATGFTSGSVSAAANIPGCVTPTISCPTKFMAMNHTATVAAGKKSAVFEYQCYRPG